ncbi:MAG: DUF1156 domain-containing protein [Pyrinomonadaceae bacterium]|nr:DUF1156 domain-containing protein [Pyrinomonadaceae bacterium]
MSATVAYRKKLIEVALPLEAINRESAREKSIRHGHPSTLHLWWARRPLAACRAVLFGSLVDDPSSLPEQFPTEEAQKAERDRLFRIIEELVKWENSNNETVLQAARNEILRSTNGNPPPILDPFCGGGSIPLEAQRLGLEAHGSDLNPVAVLITKALIEIPPKFAGRPPINPEAREKLDHTGGWTGARGLAEDVRYYGRWMRDEAERRIGHLYPKVRLENGKDATVIAWLWARTVRCPNPACGARMPLVRSFWLSTKKGKEAWVEPVVDLTAKTVSFEVRTNAEQTRKRTAAKIDGEREIILLAPPEGTVNRRGATCIVCSTVAPLDHVRAEGKAGRMSAQMMAIVAEGERARVYVSPNEEQSNIAAQAEPHDVPDTDLPKQALGFRVQGYGMTKHRDLFTPRQLVALMMFSDLVKEARNKILEDARAASVSDDNLSLDENGTGATAYADAVATYLTFVLSKTANYGSSLCSWHQSKELLVSTFGLPVLSFVWDYTEINPFSESTGNWMLGVSQVAKTLAATPAHGKVLLRQLDATQYAGQPGNWLVSTDPPYYDNVPYADLSDFFYVWLRRTLSKYYPSLLSTLLVPKKQELVADQFRHGTRENAQRFFEEGLGKAFKQMASIQKLDYPLTIFYAFKQAENEAVENESGRVAVASTGWETMLEGLVKSGFVVNGTLPMRTEQPGGLREAGRNSLASSIVLVCRPRPANAPLATRREFLNNLKRELPDALRKLQHGNIAPVDLAQAAIGPGMAVFSRYSRVVESDGTPMRVRTALQIINQTLDETLSEQEGEFDKDTRWAIAWFEQFGANEGAYGTAEVLATAKATSVSGMVESGIVTARAGKVRLVPRAELPADWNPTTDTRLTVWEVTQHLIHRLDTGGEASAAQLLAQVGSLGDTARDLAYRLYTTSERKGWTQEALAYNSLVVAWSEVGRAAAEQAKSVPVQETMIGF